MSIFPAKILLATDGSREATLAAHIAADLANKTDSELHIVHVRPRVTPHHPGFYVGPEVLEGAAEKERKLLDHEAHKLLDAQVEQVRTAGASTAQAHLRIGRADKEIVATAEELGAGLVVIGSRGQGAMRRTIMGSVSDSVVRHAHCPVLVVRKEKQAESAEVGMVQGALSHTNFGERRVPDVRWIGLKGRSGQKTYFAQTMRLRYKIFAQMERRYGSQPPKLGRSKAKAWEEQKKLMKAQQREGQPTLPKFVDPGNPPSFQETMWKKGYKCVGGDWQEYYSD